MRGNKFLTKPREYEWVFRQGKSRSSNHLVLKTVPNNLDHSRYGISVNRRVGKAVVRNRVKRRLREILRSIVMRQGWDMVFIVRSSAAASTYQILAQEVDELMIRGGVTEASRKLPADNCQS